MYGFSDKSNQKFKKEKTRVEKDKEAHTCEIVLSWLIHSICIGECIIGIIALILNFDTNSLLRSFDCRYMWYSVLLVIICDCVTLVLGILGQINKMIVCGPCVYLFTWTSKILIGIFSIYQLPLIFEINKMAVDTTFTNQTSDCTRFDDYYVMVMPTTVANCFTWLFTIVCFVIRTVVVCKSLN